MSSSMDTSSDSAMSPVLASLNTAGNADYDSELYTCNVQGEDYMLPKRYRIDGVIGRGAYGEVCQGQDQVSNTPVAIKKNKRIFQQQNKKSLIPIRVLRELKVVCHLNHPNIVNLQALIIPESYEQFNDIYMVMELMQADLRDLLVSGQKLSDKHVQYIIYQILLALAYVHSADILHRDLKPENILLNSDCVLKLCDFGLARGIDFDNDPRMSTNYVQTRYYRAPELLLNSPTVTKQADIWSVGCIMAELLTGGKILFKGTSPVNQIEKIVSIIGTPESFKASPQGNMFMKQLRHYDRVPISSLFDQDISPVACDLIKRMLEFDPSNRTSAADALKHPYFSDVLNEAEVVIAETKFDFTFEEKCDTIEGIKQEAFNTILEFNGIVKRVNFDNFELMTPINGIGSIESSPMDPQKSLTKRLSSNDLRKIDSRELSRYGSFEVRPGTASQPHPEFNDVQQNNLERRKSQLLKEEAQKDLLQKIMDQKDLEDEKKKKSGGLFTKMRRFLNKSQGK